MSKLIDEFKKETTIFLLNQLSEEKISFERCSIIAKFIVSLPNKMVFEYVDKKKHMAPEIQHILLKYQHNQAQAIANEQLNEVKNKLSALMYGSR